MLQATQQHNATKLLFDIGFNSGADSKFFTSKGFTVVGVDADPTWIEKGNQQLHDEIQNKQLLLLHAGIEEEVSSPLTFWKNRQVLANSVLCHMGVMLTSTVPRVQLF